MRKLGLWSSPSSTFSLREQADWMLSWMGSRKSQKKPDYSELI